MYNFFKKQQQHTPEPERKYGLYAWSYYLSGLIASAVWLWLFAFNPIEQSFADVRGAFDPAYAVARAEQLAAEELAREQRRQNKKPLTLEEQAAQLFPDPPPLSPYSQVTDGVFSDPSRTRAIQALMHEWERRTGQDFLTDHWTMQPSKNEGTMFAGAFELNPPDGTGYGEFPNLFAAYMDAEANILYQYTTTYHMMATTAEMQQCIEPPRQEVKKPRACSDPDRAFMIAECFQVEDTWSAPPYCRDGYHAEAQTTVVHTLENRDEHPKGFPVDAECLVSIENYGNPRGQEVRNNGVEIRGDFADLQGGTRVVRGGMQHVLCGQVWRDFATAVYNARTDQEFIAADPNSTITPQMMELNRQAQERHAAAMREAQQKRAQWLIEQREKQASVSFFPSVQAATADGNDPIANLTSGSSREGFRTALLFIGCAAIFLWVFAVPKWAIMRKPRFLPARIWIVGLICFGVYFLTFMGKTDSMAPTLGLALGAFLPPMLFLTVPTYAMVIKEYVKETQFYQETAVEGRGRETGRWAGFKTYFMRDITKWFAQSRHLPKRIKDSPIFVGRTMWQYDYKIGGRDIGLTSEQHLITVGGTGAGKSRDVLFNNILAYNGGILAFDTKGEHEELAFDRRSEYAPCYLLDGYGKSKTGRPTDYWNPIYEIDPNSPSARGNLKRLAAAIVPKEKGERAVDIHFREIPHKIVRGYIAHILTTYPKEKHHLGSLYDLFVKGDPDAEGFDPTAVEKVIREMAKNDAIGGAPSEAAAVLAVLSDRDRSAHYSSISRSLDWVNDPNIRPMICAPSTFSLEECKTHNASVFLIIPEKNLDEMSRFLRLFYTVAFDVLDEHETPQPEGSNRRTLFLFDEFEVLGTFEVARQAVLRKRSSYLKCWFIVQNFGQFKANYENLSDFFGNCDKQFFGVDATDVDLFEIISEALGRYTDFEFHDGKPTKVARPVMSQGTLAKFLDAARDTQIVIPLQGLPMRLRRLPFYRHFGWFKFYRP